MKIEVGDYLGKYVEVTTTDGQICRGFCAMAESEYDSDDGIPSITLTGTEQFGVSLVDIFTNEMAKIRIIDKNDL